MLLKIFTYGYSYGVRSSRKLERACHHNLSFIWLTGGLKPDCRTIGRFRKENKSAIKQILRQNARLCIELGLIEGNSLFVDGSKFRANAGISNSWNKKRCEKYLKRAEENIERIMEEAERLDKLEEDSGSLIRLEEELLKQKEVQEKIKEIASTLKKTGQTSVNTTDIESIKAKGRQGTHASYNAQIVVDEKHGLIVNTEVVSRNNDKNQLSGPVSQAIDVLEKNPGTVICDSGYHSLVDLEKVSEELETIYESTEGQEKYKLRKEKVELPFGHIKSNLGAGQFLLRGRKGVNSEFSILSTCFNISRMITIFGIPGLISRLKECQYYAIN